MEESSVHSSRWVGWFLVLLASVLLAIAIYNYFFTQHFLQTGVWTKGTISGQNFQNDPDGYFYSPVVTYRDRQGLMHSWISSTASNPARFQIGEVVDVVYRNENPDDALIVVFWELYLFIIVMGGLGAVILIMAVLILCGSQQSLEKR